VVAKLVAQGLVERVRSVKDARQLELSLTPEGRRLLRNAPNLAQDRLIGALKSMGGTQVAALARLLAEFVHAAGLSDQVPAMLFEEEGHLTRKPAARGR
jgi:DNA-binding MarR family transcriptional regulator